MIVFVPFRDSKILEASHSARETLELQTRVQDLTTIDQISLDSTRMLSAINIDPRVVRFRGPGTPDAPCSKTMSQQMLLSRNEGLFQRCRTDRRARTTDLWRDLHCL